MLLVTLAVLSSSSVSAAEFAELRLGFNGLGRVGNLMPVRVRVAECPPTTEVVLAMTAADPQGNLCQDLVARGQVGTDGLVALAGVFSVGRLDGSVHVALLDEKAGRILCERTIPVVERDLRTATMAAADESAIPVPEVADRLNLLRQSAWCLLCVGAPAGLRDMEQTQLNSRKDHVSFSVLSVPDVASLPDSRFGLDGIDIVLLTDDFSLTEVQTIAVREWVQTGGRLLISSGSKTEPLLESPFGNWVAPYFGIETPSLSVRDLAALQNFVPGAVQLQTNRIGVPMTRLSADHARVIVTSLDGPIIARLGVGSGIITFVAVDLNQRPVNNWRSLSKLYEMLVFDELTESVASQGTTRSIRISSSGISDLSTQLSAVFDAIPPADRWSSWQIMAMIVGYLLVIGPLDYVLVVHVFRRPHLTWVTFPLLVLVGCGFVYAGAGKDKPGQIHRQLHVLDIAGARDGQTVHARSWVSLSSATTGRSNITAVPVGTAAVAVADAATGVPARGSLRWSGRSEDVYGGMYRTGGAGLGRQKYQRTESEVEGEQMLSSVPLLAEGSQCFLLDRFGTHSGTPLFESGFSASGTGLIEGDLISRLPMPINNWIVFYGNRVYLPSPQATEDQRSLAPGLVWNRRHDWVRASDLKSFLTGQRLVPKRSGDAAQGTVRGESQQVSTPYNSRGENPLDILMMVSLYNAAGAESYVGLRNDPLRRMELTDSIRLNYALLLGTVDTPLAEFSVDGQTAPAAASTTVVRFLIPVSRQQSVGPAKLKADEDNLPAADKPLFPETEKPAAP